MRHPRFSIALCCAVLAGCSLPDIGEGPQKTYFAYTKEELAAIPDEPIGMELPTAAQLMTWDTRLMDIVRVKNYAPTEAARLYAAVAVAQYDALLLGAHAAGVDAAGALTTCALIKDTCAHMDIFMQNDGYNLKIATMTQGRVTGHLASAPPSPAKDPGDVPLVWDKKKAVTPDAGDWPRWGTGGALEPPPPPAPGSLALSGQLKAMASATRVLSPQQMHRMMYWNNGDGTERSAGLWLGLSHSMIVSHAVSDPVETARIRAILTMAMADAAMNCWKAKYEYWTQVPSQQDTSILVMGMGAAPNYPNYPSELATVSGAASAVLQRVFPDSYEEFAARSQEAANSQIWMGTYTPSDSVEGLVLGRRTAQRILDDPRFFIADTLWEEDVPAQ